LAIRAVEITKENAEKLVPDIMLVYLNNRDYMRCLETLKLVE